MRSLNGEIANVILGRFERATAAEEPLKLTMERHYDTTVWDLWDAVTDPDRLARWFASVNGDLREGGHCVVDFEDEDDAQTAAGQITKCRPPEELQVSWRCPGEAESHVAVSIHHDGAGALLKLEHLGLTEPAAADYGAGWQAYIEALETDLRGEPARGPAWDERWGALVSEYKQLLP